MDVPDRAGATGFLRGTVEVLLRAHTLAEEMLADLIAAVPVRIPA